MSPIRLLIAEDQTILREMYLTTLADTPNIIVEEAVADGAAAVEAAQRLHPDVVLLDIQMPNLNGIEAAQRIRADQPEIAIILLSHYSERQYAEAFLREGAAGKAYLLKTTLNEPAELVRAIETVQRGGTVLAQEIQEELLQLALTSPDSPLNLLTKREIEVLQLMAEGYTNISIAQKLTVSARTVESHIKNIFDKFGLSAEANRNPRVMAVLQFLQTPQLA